MFMCDVLGFLDQVVAQYLHGVFLHPTPAPVLLWENERGNRYRSLFSRSFDLSAAKVRKHHPGSPYCPESFDRIIKNKLPGKLFFFRSIRSSSVAYIRALYTGASQYIANWSDSSCFFVGF